MDGHALGFVRLPISDQALGGCFAGEIALGTHFYDGDRAAMGKLTLSYGRSFSGPGGGCLAIDAAVEHRQGFAHTVWKFDTTLGLPSQRKTRPMLQLDSITIPGDRTFWTFTSSLVIDTGGGRNVLVGLEGKHNGDVTSVGFKFGLWRSF